MPMNAKSRALTTRTNQLPGKMSYRYFLGVKWVPLSALLRTEMIYLDSSLAGPQIVLNGGAVAVKATPLRGRLQIEP